MIIDTKKLKKSIEIYSAKKFLKIENNKNISDRRAIRLFTALETQHLKVQESIEKVEELYRRYFPPIPGTKIVGIRRDELKEENHEQSKM